MNQFKTLIEAEIYAKAVESDGNHLTRIEEKTQDGQTLYIVWKQFYD